MIFILKKYVYLKKIVDIKTSNYIGFALQSKPIYYPSYFPINKGLSYPSQLVVTSSTKNV